MEIRKDNLYIQKAQSKVQVQKSDPKVEREEKDFVNSPNPAEYIGRSQVVFASRHNKNNEKIPNGLDLNKEQLEPISLLENKPISKDDATEFLKYICYTDDDINNIDLDDEENLKSINNIKTMLNLEMMKEHQSELFEELANSSPQDRIEIIDSMKKLKYLNQKNIDKLSQYIDLDPEYLYDTFAHISDSENKDIFLKKLPLVAYVQGKLPADKMSNIYYWDKYEDLDLDSANLMKEINSDLPNDARISVGWYNQLGKKEDLTKDKIKEYQGLVNYFNDNYKFDVVSTSPSYENNSINQLTERMNSAKEILEKYPMDLSFSDDDKLTLPFIEKVTKRKDIQDVQNFVNQLTPDSKKNGILEMPEEDVGVPKEKFAKIYNLIFDKDYGAIYTKRVLDFLKSQKENGYKDIDGITSLIETYKGTDNLNYPSDFLSVANGDYQGAIDTYKHIQEVNKEKSLIPDDYYTKFLQNPDMDFKNLQKTLNFIKENNVNCFAFPLEDFTDQKGYNKIVLRQKVGQYYPSESIKDFRDLGDIIENDEDLNYALGLFDQNLYPNSDDYGSRFKGNPPLQVKNLMSLYNQDKTITKKVIEAKEPNGDWRFSPSSIPDVIKAYQTDEDFTNYIVGLKEGKYSRFGNGETIKKLVDISKTDKEYVKEILNLENKSGHGRGLYRFSDADKIKQIVECSKIDKEFTNYLLAQKMLYEDSTTRLEGYRIHNPEELKYLVDKAQTDKEFVKELVDATEQNYGNEKLTRLSFSTIKNILDNPVENREFLKEILNKKGDKAYYSNRYLYNDYQISELAQAANINKDLTESVLNETFTYGNEVYNRFRDTSEILNLVKASNSNPEFAQSLLQEKTSSGFGEPVFRFDGNDIACLVKLADEYGIDDVKTLVNMKKNSYNSQMPRFGSYEIQSVLSSMKTNRALTEELLAETKPYKDGSLYSLYNSYDIENIVKADEVHPTLTRELLDNNKKNKNIFQGYVINELANAATLNEKITKRIINNIINNDGSMNSDYDRYSIPRIVGAFVGKEDLDFILDYKNINSRGEIGPRFTVSEIIDMLANVSTDDEKAFFKELVTLTKPDDNSVPRFTGREIALLLNNSVTKEKYSELQNLMSSDFDDLSASDILEGLNFKNLYNVKELNEISMNDKKSLLKNLVSINTDLFHASPTLKKYFPLLPSNLEEYCELLPSIVRSIGIETQELKPNEIEKFNNSVSDLTSELSGMSDAEFDKLEINQDYKKDDFIKNVIERIQNKSLSKDQIQKVYDYYGFELKENENSPIGYALSGYPAVLDKKEKLENITDPETKSLIKELEPEVIRFSKKNKISSNNKKVEKLMNDIVSALPESRVLIDKKDDQLHGGTMMKNALKTLQKLGQDKDFQLLDDSDKKIMYIAALMQNVSKREGCEDLTHAKESSFDTFFIAKKFKLSKSEEIKLSTLINTHEWLTNMKSSDLKGCESIAFDTQQNNNFELSRLLVKANIDTIDKSNIDVINSQKEELEKDVPIIKEKINELKISQPLLPTTKMPKSSTIEKNITYVNEDGSTNLKGVYKDKDGLVVVKFNEVEDWEKLGLPKGSSTKGYTAKTLNDEAETGNIKFFVHGLDYPNQLTKFDAFSLVDSDALLSVSYTERPETKYRFFRPQGVLLDVLPEYVYGGGNTDSGSGCGKSIDNFKQNYVFGGYRQHDRDYISSLIKEATGMNDEEYVEFVEKNKGKSMIEIEPEELRKVLIEKFATINSNHRKGDRSYNEMYISNPRNVMGVFVYGMDNSPIKDTMAFIDEQNPRIDFLRKYAKEHDIPMYVFGE